jgi:mRNA interferase MazF
MIRRGYVYWVRMPGEGKRRPALVLSNDIRNDRGNTVVVVPCTTVPRPGPWHVALTDGEAGLKRHSMVKCEDVTSVEKHRLIPRALGPPLSSERLRQVREGLLKALDFA